MRLGGERAPREAERGQAQPGNERRGGGRGAEASVGPALPGCGGCNPGMSDVVERTLLSALPGWLGQQQQQQKHEAAAGLGGGGGGGGPARPGRSASASRLGGLIRSITALASKHEEEKLIHQELNNLKATVSAPTTNLKLMKECMVRMIYCEMLGYEASFGYIHAIKLAQQGNLFEKRVGYLAISLFLHENHELLVLLVNTVVKDLQSTNLMEVCMALTAASQLFPQEMIPAVLPLIEDKLQHSKEIIRRKAVQALYKFYLIAPNQVQHIHDKFRRALCDRDVGVMAASLHIYLQMVKEDSSEYKDLTSSFVTILKQVVGGKLPVDYNYHNTPAPWLQIQLLRILRLLGKDDPGTSELMYDVLDESLRRAEINHNITYAILFECVHTIYAIHPKPDLLEKAAKCIGKFVLSPKINLKYLVFSPTLGLKALTYVIQQDPNLALQHQMTIIECLEHPDPIIKRETLELLYRITNEQNVTVIVQKMLDYINQSKEEYTIINIAGKIAELAEKYAPNNEWFIQTMNAVFSVGGDKMHPDILNSFLRLLAEGFEDEKEDIQLRFHAVQSYLSLLQDKNAVYPQKFIQVMSWVLGEYSYLLQNVDPEVVLASLYRILKSNATCETKVWIMAAISKTASRTTSSKTVEKFLLEFSASLDTSMRQQAFELKCLYENKELMKRLFPLDASCKNMVVDASLSFLDGFVAEGLNRGALPYKPHHQRQEEKLSQEKALNFEPYGESLSQSFPVSRIAGRQSPTGISLGSDNSVETGQKENSSLKLDGVKKLWSKEGYLPQKKNQEEKEEKTTEAALQGVPSVETVASTFPSQPKEEVTDHTEGAKEKQQLASALFVGLGSQNSTNLMGKTDSEAQKFTKKSKMNKESSLPMESAPTTSLFQEGLTGEKDPFVSNGHLKFRKASLHSPEIPESKTMLDRSHSLPEGGLNEKSLDHPFSPSSSFTHDHVDVFHPSPSSPALVQKQLSLTPRLPEEAAQHPHLDISELCGNESLLVYFSKVWKEDHLLIFLCLANKSSSVLKDVSLEFQHSEHFKMVENLDCQLAVLESEKMESFQRYVEMEKPCSSGNIFGCISYPLELDVRLRFSISLELLDFIRPMKMSTDEFGNLWLSISNEVRQNLKVASSQGTLSLMLDTFQQKLKLHIVDIIGNEGIAACRLLPSTPCLLHCRLHGGTLALWFRSPCSALPDCLLYQCQKVMEES
ncbi:AP-4 complex subunit epsilon-1 isoform X1 [Ahaetulla prasina]|uniref:AP-4 complex subunit epsilon-1 isoform X1 n=1 Tax=Ahaetulla prasina TaxID=499056 RepID=UPI0026498044|nr:AP-4 complex subunit epsilon-1 isoform X1 [Ahaetulla prasina]